ncbi:MAG: hypothetical protein ACRCX5_12215 [Bacteroidales bacterium]
MTNLKKEKSNLVNHAEYEMQLAWGGFEKMDEMQKLMCDQVLELLEVLSTQGDSGSSIGYKINLLKRLVEFKTISPLTFNDNEFGEPFDLDRTRQNKRNSKFFLKPDGKVQFLNGLHFLQSHTCYVYDNKEKPFFEKNDNPIAWSGGAFVLMNDGSTKQIKRCLLKDKSNYSKEFNIESFDIEYPKDCWIRFTTEDRIKEAREYYDIPLKDATEYFNKEVYGYKEGKYLDEILKRIELLKEYIKTINK